MRYDVIGLVAGWSLILLTIPLFISAIVGHVMDDPASILLWSFIPPIAFCAIVGTIFVKIGTRRDSADRLRDRDCLLYTSPSPRDRG